jgi:hypothetical protein
MWYPRSHYRLGKAYERAGNVPEALRSYDFFLKLWKDADPNLEELVDAKARSDALRAVVQR